MFLRIFAVYLKDFTASQPVSLQSG